LPVALSCDEHVRRYVETGGQVGHEWNGVDTLVLTTTGRTSGQPRQNAIIYVRHGDSYVVIASQGGLPSDPNWYLNLTADPDVEVQVGPTRFSARARTAEGEKREQLWRVMAGIWPNFEVYRTRTDRRIPVVVLDPA
jgi:deazaflavin-dependent oxidoreductase (nitroreductase family)